jgi:hypothetical protein
MARAGGGDGGGNGGGGDGGTRRRRPDPHAAAMRMLREPVVSIRPRYAIEVVMDRAARTISVRDYGPGLRRPELRERFTTVSKTLNQVLRAQLRPGGVLPGADLVSWFTVADRVVVQTRPAGHGQSLLVADASAPRGVCHIGPDVLSPSLVRGTRITLHLRPEAAELLLAPTTIAQIVEVARGGSHRGVTGAVEAIPPIVLSSAPSTAHAAGKIVPLASPRRPVPPAAAAFLCLACALATGAALYMDRDDGGGGAACNEIFAFVWVNFAVFLVLFVAFAIRYAITMAPSLARRVSDTLARRGALRMVLVDAVALFAFALPLWGAVGASWILDAELPNLCTVESDSVHKMALAHLALLVILTAVAAGWATLALASRWTDTNVARYHALHAALAHRAVPREPDTRFADPIDDPRAGTETDALKVKPSKVRLTRAA